MATAQQDETKSDQIDIEIISAMVSDAIITLDEEQEGDIEVEPGSSYDLAFNVQNMASRMDVFQPSLEYTGQTGWGIDLVNPYHSQLMLNHQRLSKLESKFLKIHRLEIVCQRSS